MKTFNRLKPLTLKEKREILEKERKENKLLPICGITTSLLAMLLSCSSLSSLEEREYKGELSMRAEMIIGVVGRVIFDDNEFDFPIETLSIKRKIKGRYVYQRVLNIESYNAINGHNLIITSPSFCQASLLTREKGSSLGKEIGYTSSFLLSSTCQLKKVIVFDQEKTYLYKFRALSYQYKPFEDLPKESKEKL